jgi:5-methylcytosine-specific restriction endonuclease McrA
MIKSILLLVIICLYVTSSFSQSTGPPDLPDQSLTPGARFDVDTPTVCKPGYSKTVRDVPESEKKAVYNSYSVQPHQGYCDCPEGCEVDHLISLEIGGSNEQTNLWPQPYCGDWNAHMKDRLENYLHKQMCDGTMTMSDVQQQISTNWITAYNNYIAQIKALERAEGLARYNPNAVIPQAGTAPTLPDPTKTPGAKFKVSKKKVCKPGYSKTVRDVPESEKEKVYKSYNVEPHKGYCDCEEGCEVDHLISLEIGGSNDESNLWPQPYCGEWNAHMKDRLENYFHEQMCKGSMTMEEVQQQISTNWITAYTKYIKDIEAWETLEKLKGIRLGFDTESKGYTY